MVDVYGRISTAVWMRLTLKSAGFDHFQKIVVTHGDFREMLRRKSQGSGRKDLDSVHPLDVNVLQFAEIANGTGYFGHFGKIDNVDEINIRQSNGSDFEDFLHHGVGHVGHISEIDFSDGRVDVVGVAPERVQHFGRFEFAAVNTSSVAAEILKLVDSAW